MTIGSTPREPWDDGRLDAAFAARAARTSTPIDLAGATRAALQHRRAAVPLWRRILAPAAVVVLAVGVVGAGVVLPAGEQAARTPEPSDPAVPAPSSAFAGRPTVFGLPVMTVSEAIDVRESGDDDREIAVRAWYPPTYPVRACGRATDMLPVSPLQETCPDQLLWLMRDPEPLGSVTPAGISWRGPTGPAISPHLDDVDMAWAAPHDDLTRLVELVIVGHFDDSRSGGCPPAEQQACRDRFVVDRVHSVDGVNQPLSIVDRVDGAELSSPDDIRAAVDAGATVRPILSMVIVDARVEGLTDGPSSTVWVAQVLGESWVEHHVVYDGTDEVFMVRLSGPPKFALPRPVLDITVISVPELIARREADPSPDEIAVRGWIASSNSIFDCAIHMDPHHPLVPFCDSPTFLMERSERPNGTTTQGPSVAVIIGPDAHSDVLITWDEPIEVVAIGHLDDHRWPTCPDRDQEACRRQFVVDRILPADATVEDVPEPWRLRGSAPSEPVAEPSGVIRRLEALVGDITVVSIGFVDGDILSHVEPAAAHPDHADALFQHQPLWVVRALVKADPDPATARTFLIPDVTDDQPTGTAWEAGASGIDPIPDPDAQSWPPDGATIVELTSPVGAGRPPMRVAVVDHSGWLTSVREARSDDPSLPTIPDADGALVTDSAGRLRLFWTGSVCDGDAVVTIGPDFETIHIDGGTRPACDAMAIGRELVLETSEPVDPARVRVSYEVIVDRDE